MFYAFLEFLKITIFLLIMGDRAEQIYWRPDEKNFFLAQNDSQNVSIKMHQKM